MIEVEKKFRINETVLSKIVEQAQFVSEKEIRDIYYDFDDYSITCQDIWFRERDDAFELKVSLNRNIQRDRAASYKEITDEQEIRNFLELDKELEFKQAIQKKDIHPFAGIITSRKKYKKDEFIIDIDTMNFDYQLAEIELIVQEESQIEEAENKILQFAQSLEIGNENVQGKLIEFLDRNNPAHISALRDAGVMQKHGL